MKAYPHRFVPSLWWLAWLLLASGLLLVPGMLALRLEWDVPDTWIGPRSWYAAAHGMLAFISLLFMGALLAIHVRHGLRQKHSRKSGLTLLFVLPLPVLTGWGIYYIANEHWAAGLSIVHTATALLIAIPMTAHAIAARRQRRAGAAWSPRVARPGK
jgi:cation transport ATPase